MKKRIKYAINFIFIFYIIFLLVVYFEKDSQFFPDGPPIGFVLNFNGSFFFSFFASLWFLFDSLKVKEIFTVLIIYGVLGLLIPTKECQYASLVLLTVAFLLFFVYLGLRLKSYPINSD